MGDVEQAIKRRNVRLAIEAGGCDFSTMATGLATFDNFTWASLLKGRRSLVVDRDRQRAMGYGAALEEAGASVTMAPSQAIAGDRCREGAFRLALLSLGPEETVSERLAPLVERPGTDLVILCDPKSHGPLRARFSNAKIGDHSMSSRDLVMFVLASADE